MKFDVDDKNRCRFVCVKFHLNRCRFAVAVAKCLGGSLFGDSVYFSPNMLRLLIYMNSLVLLANDWYSIYLSIVAL